MVGRLLVDTVTKLRACVHGDPGEAVSWSGLSGSLSRCQFKVNFGGAAVAISLVADRDPQPFISLSRSEPAE